MTVVTTVTVRTECGLILVTLLLFLRRRADAVHSIRSLLSVSMRCCEFAANFASLLLKSTSNCKIVQYNVSQKLYHFYSMICRPNFGSCFTVDRIKYVIYKPLRYKNTCIGLKRKPSVNIIPHFGGKDTPQE